MHHLNSHARDHGCTHLDCAKPGYHCEVNHAVDYAAGGPTDEPPDDDP